MPAFVSSLQLRSKGLYFEDFPPSPPNGHKILNIASTVFCRPTEKRVYFLASGSHHFRCDPYYFKSLLFHDNITASLASLVSSSLLRYACVYSWRQGGTTGDDKVNAAAMAEDGSVLMAGWTSGTWGEAEAGFYDFVAVKLDAAGKLLWNWQVWPTYNTSTLESLSKQHETLVFHVENRTAAAWHMMNVLKIEIVEPNGFFLPMMSDVSHSVQPFRSCLLIGWID